MSSVQERASANGSLRSDRLRASRTLVSRFSLARPAAIRQPAICVHTHARNPSKKELRFSPLYREAEFLALESRVEDTSLRFRRSARRSSYAPALARRHRLRHGETPASNCAIRMLRDAVRKLSEYKIN